MRKKENRRLTADNREPIPDFKEVKVKLKPLLGIKPGVYLPVFYLISIFVILFLLLFYPGLRQNGRYYKLVSNPENAAIYVDGNYVGHTPGDVFLKSGQSVIKIGKPFFKSTEIAVDVKPQIFGSLFYKSRKSISVELQIEDLRGLVEYSAKDFATTPYITSIIGDTCDSLYAVLQGEKEQRNEVLCNFLYFLRNSLYFSTGEEQLREIMRGFIDVESLGNFLTPLSLFRAVNMGFFEGSRYNTLPFLIALSLSEKHREQLTSSEWFKDVFSRYLRDVTSVYSDLSRLKADKRDVPVRFITVSGIKFSLIPEGRYLLGNTVNMSRLQSGIDILLPTVVDVKSFYISTTEVTVRSFLEFLRENPRWRRDNLNSLVAKGLVSSNYLKDLPDRIDYKNLTGLDKTMLTKPVRYVSFWAAKAYTGWLTTRVRMVYPHYEARLPSEAEWERAARGGNINGSYATDNADKAVFYTPGITGPKRVGFSSPNGYGLYDMSGNLWEWCENWFSPVSYFLSPNGPLIGAEKVVRGGSWANQRELVPLYIRGSQPPKWCTGYTGFRVVLAKINK